MATPSEIDAAGARLGSRLPPTYRQALLAGDALLPGEHGMALLSVSEIDRFSVREPGWLAAWLTGYELGGDAGEADLLADDSTDPATAPVGELGDSVVISTTGDERLLLLNPARVDDRGEWEAWDFATWYPGAYRYRSFADLVAALARE